MTTAAQTSLSSVFIPSLTFTTSTPPRRGPSVASNDPTSSTPKNCASRLLYRGALSLPDSYLLLDGLTFVVDLPTDDPQAGLTLLENPLPLALESMRGRPSLRFMGVEKMDDLFCDFSGGVGVHIHPRSILTHQLFTNHLCAVPVISSIGRTDLGIRIRLGDSDSILTMSSDIIIYGRPHPSSSIMQLCVARIVPAPPPAALLPKAVTKLRLPRPDDPTPRKPPLTFNRKDAGMKRALDKGKGKEKDAEDGTKKKSKKEETILSKGPAVSSRLPKPPVLPKTGIKDLGKNSRVGSGFKVPTLPLPTGRGNVRRDEDDVFLDNAGPKEDVSDLEAGNKLIIKKAAVRLLGAAGIPKQHPEFKEFFGHVYRGVGFALRSRMKTTTLEDGSDLIDRVASTHIRLYLHGDSDSGGIR